MKKTLKWLKPGNPKASNRSVKDLLIRNEAVTLTDKLLLLHLLHSNKHSGENGRRRGVSCRVDVSQ